MKKELIFGLSLALVSTGAFAQELGFGDWDTDADGFVNESEWDAGLAENDVFGGWDANDDGLLDENEWGEIGTDVGFGDWEADNEIGLNEDEFGEGLYSEYDEDADTMWGEDEWASAEDEGWFDW